MVRESYWLCSRMPTLPLLRVAVAVYKGSSAVAMLRSTVTVDIVSSKDSSRAKVQNRKLGFLNGGRRMGGDSW